MGDLEGLGGNRAQTWIFEVSLRGGEDELFARMSSGCRRAIRKAEKSGVVIEEASGRDCADDYYAQLRDVFAKQRLVASHGIERVRRLIDELHPTGRLLLLRARDPEGRCIATGIFPAMNRTMHFWGGASWREHQILRPNEAILWYAMRYWGSRGIEVCDLGGTTPYKRKYGPETVLVPSFQTSTHRTITRMRGLAEQAYRRQQQLRGHLTTAEAVGRLDAR